MKIPVWYYISFWIEFSILSTVTGTLLGFLCTVILGPYAIILGVIFGVICGQVSIINHYVGKKRGRFEFLYQKHLTYLKTYQALANNIGWLKTIIILFTEIGEINWSSGEHYDKLLAHKNEVKDIGMIYLRAGIIAQRRRNYERCIKLLNEAHEFGYKNLLSFYILAQSYERIGDGESAITQYEEAGINAKSLSIRLTSYISSQIERVKIRGPSKKPSMPGLRHSGMGR